MKLCLYSGAGNTFVVLDGRKTLPEFDVVGLCTRYGTDGLMVLRTASDCDFEMDYYNSDGSGGMMCGNGGRCIVAFADHLGIQPRDGKVYAFRAADGMHTGEVLEREGEQKTVRLRMIDVTEFHPALDGWFLDTGTRHFVCFRQDIEAVDVEKEGAVLRHDSRFAPQGANVNFVSPQNDLTIAVRTFEKGVEAETLACGTGITASAIASYAQGIEPTQRFADGVVSYAVQARRDRLSVRFRPSVQLAETAGDDSRSTLTGLRNGPVASEVYLTGPATFIGTEEL